MEKEDYGIDSCWYERVSSLLHLIEIDIDKPPLHRF
jgi:hypothetical protein